MQIPHVHGIAHANSHAHAVCDVFADNLDRLHVGVMNIAGSKQQANGIQCTSTCHIQQNVSLHQLPGSMCTLRLVDMKAISACLVSCTSSISSYRTQGARTSTV